MSVWWVPVCYVCDSVMYVTSTIDVSSTHMNKTFIFFMTVCRSDWSMILVINMFWVASWLFPLFLVCFVLDLCCYLHNNLAQVYMSCVLTFGINPWKCILLEICMQIKIYTCFFPFSLEIYIFSGEIASSIIFDLFMC